MKGLKKSLAVLLAVLMVVFSVPFTASAATIATEKANISLQAFSCYAEANKIKPLPIYWGAQEGISPYADDYVIPSGEAVALAFMLSGVDQVRMFQLTGTIDTNKLVPTAPTSKKVGTKWTPTGWEENFDSSAWIDGMSENFYFTDSDTSQLNWAAAYFEAPNRICSTVDTGDYPVVLNGTSVFQKIVYDEATDTYSDLVLDGTIITVGVFLAQQDIAVRDLYSCFNFELDNINTCFSSTGDVDNYLTFGPASTDPPTPAKDTYTYTFADGSQQTVEVDAGATPKAPDNTAAVITHVDGTETHKTTTYAWAADGDMAFKEVGTDTTAACSFKETSAAVAPVHTKDTLTDGKTAVETCEVCNYTKGGEVITAAHSYVKTEVPATCEVKAHDHYECSCGAAYDDNFTGELAAHNWAPTGNTRGDATCVTAGEVEYACSVCGATEWRSGAYGPHTLTAHAEVPADCLNAGTEAYWTCDVCNKMFSDAEGTTEITEVQVIPALNHSFTNYVNNNDATCQKNATETAKCDRCDATDTREIPDSTVAHQFTVAGETTPGTCVDKAQTVMSCAFGCGETEIVYGDVDPANHKNVEVKADTAVAPTRGTAGKEADKVCTACGVTVEEGAVIPALGVNITVQSSSLGTAAINGEDIANATKNVPYESAYTLTATANEGAEFVGWMVGNKIVSADETYTTNAYADMTYTPVFATVDSADFTVTFVDSYGNVVTTLTNTEIADLTALPEAPAFAGLTFTGWDKTLDEVKALTASATVTAQYANDTDTQYTVTATGCTITVDGVDYTDTASVTYNTLVTVKAENATAWTVNGSATPAAYGAEYSFYCGSDITVASVTKAVTATPAVKAVSMEKTATHKVTFLATRSVPEGFTLVESGFVYGKGMAAEDLVLENVGKVAGSANGTVKQIVCNNKAADGQFSLSYGVTAMNASASAAAYVIYRQGNQSVVIYGDAMIYNY